MQYYNFTTIELVAAGGATKIALKAPAVDCSPFIADAASGHFIIDTTDWKPGKYYYQQYDATGAVVESGTIEIRQNLQYAGADFDPRTHEEQTLEALKAKAAGTATNAQLKVQVDGKAIDFMQYDELMKWINRYERLVAAQQGRPQKNIELMVMR